MQTLSPLDPDELDHVVGGVSLPLSMTPDRPFNDEGPLLTEALRRGMNRPAPRAHARSPRPGVHKSTVAPGWCEDGFGIVPCR